MQPSLPAPAIGAVVFKFRLPGGWMLVALLIALLTLVPVAVVLSSLFTPEREIWAHLVQYQLPQLLGNTFWLMLGVGLGVAILGVSLAWLTAGQFGPTSSVLLSFIL